MFRGRDDRAQAHRRFAELVTSFGETHEGSAAGHSRRCVAGARARDGHADGIGRAGDGGEHDVGGSTFTPPCAAGLVKKPM